MVRSIRPLLVVLTCLLATPGTPSARAQDKPSGKDKPENPVKTAKDAPSKVERARSYALPGEDPPEPFVPLHPRTVEDRKKVEAVTLFSVARAMEERRAFASAISVLEDALKLEPDSPTVLKRLTRLSLLLGRTEKGMDFGKRVLAIDPGDTETITRLVNYYNNRLHDPSGAESLLKDLLANPKLGANEPSRTLAHFELGRLYADKLQQVEKAADAFGKVVEALDDRNANRLPPAVQRLILGGDEAAAYQAFGQVFLLAKKYELAAKAFERGLDYEPDDPQIPLTLAQTYLKLNQGDKALAMVETYLKRQPQGVEGYDLIAKVLTALKREDEITPRLEKAAKVDSKNLALQYALADRYRETGQVEQAEAMYKQLLAAQPTTQGYSALAASLFKRKKAEELLKVILDAVGRPGGFEAVKEQMQGIATDDKFSEQVLDVAAKIHKDEPATLGRAGFPIVMSIGRIANKRDKVLPMQRLELERNPSPQTYKETFSLLFEMKKYSEAAALFEEMFGKFPDERNAKMLIELARTYRLADNPDKAVSVSRDALKLEPNDLEAKVQLGIVLSQSGKPDEAIALLREAAKANPANAVVSSILGNILTTASKNQEAITLWKELLERYPNDEDIIKTARQNLSIVYVNMGDYAKGEAELEILLARNPDEPGVNNDLGYLYAEQGKNLEKAEVMIRKAVELEPDNFSYLDSLGWVLFKRGKVQEAVEPLEKAVKVQVESMATDATIYEHLGDVYFQLRQTEKAKDAWKLAEKAATKVVPPDKRLPEIRKKLLSLDKLSAIPKPSSGETP